MNLRQAVRKYGQCKGQPAPTRWSIGWNLQNAFAICSQLYIWRLSLKTDLKGPNEMVAILKRNIPDITQIILWGLWSAFSLPGSSLSQLYLHPPVMDSTSSLSSYMWSCFWQGKISPCIPETLFLFCFCIFSPPFLLQSYLALSIYHHF